jgi:hypothetical protein
MFVLSIRYITRHTGDNVSVSLMKRSIYRAYTSDIVMGTSTAFHNSHSICVVNSKELPRFGRQHHNSRPGSQYRNYLPF